MPNDYFCLIRKEGVFIEKNSKWQKSRHRRTKLPEREDNFNTHFSANDNVKVCPQVLQTSQIMEKTKSSAVNKLPLFSPSHTMFM